MSKYLSWIIVAGLVLIGLALRLYQLEAVALRGDEAFSVSYWAGLPLSESLSQIATLEPHPPLNYAVFRLWGIIIGIDNVFALRLLPVLTNLIGIPALYAIGRSLNGRLTGVLAALLWTFHPFQIWHAQDFRNYAMWAGLSAVSLWLALRIIIWQKRNPRDWFLFGIVSLAAAMIFYMELFTIGVLWLFVLLAYYQERRFFRQWTLLTAAIVTIVGSAFLLFQGLLVGGGGYAGTTDSLNPVELITRFLPALNFGDTLPYQLQQQYWPISGLLLSGVLIVGLIVITSRNRRHALFLGLLAFAPLLMLSVVSLKMSIFRPRYVMLAAPAYVLIVVYGLILLSSRLKVKPLRYLLSALVFGGWLMMSAFSLNNYYHDAAYRKAVDWQSFTAFLAENVSQDDLVIQTSVDASFGYYYHTYFDVQTDETALPANFDQEASDIRNELEKLSTTYDSLWIVGRTFAAWQNSGVVEGWLQDNMQRTFNAEIAEIPIQQYAPLQVMPEEIEQDTLATFDDKADLVAIKVMEADATDQVYVWLYWQALENTETDLKVFVHLAGAINPETNTPLWSQSDIYPQNGQDYTSSWEPEIILRDIHVLNIRNVPPGEYTILTGWYDPATGDRLILENGETAYNAGTIILE